MFWTLRLHVWGTAIGILQTLDAQGRSELRIGVHLTAMQSYRVGNSGIQLLYQHRAASGFGVQIGLMQTSFPFGAMLVLGVIR